MAVGAVQGGYGQNTYTYQSTTTVTEEFYSEISFGAQETDEQNDSQVIGLTMIPYGNTNVSYGMKAQYAEESTAEDPVVQVTSNYGGKTVSYKVHVNKVDPRNASQLEMFALLCYADDQGISDGGTFGSYHQMKVYGENARMNGYWEGNPDLDSFVNAKYDWCAMMIRMQDDYSKAGIYSQFLKCQKLVETMSGFSLRFVDFENMEWEDKSARMSLHYAGPNVPREVAKAWLEAADETGADGMGMDDNGMLTHISSMMLQRIRKWQKGENGSGDLLGDSIESALKAAKEALDDLEYPLTEEIERSPEVQKELEKEKEFYKSFIAKLEKLSEEKAASGQPTEEVEPENDREETASHNDDKPKINYMEVFREMMEEIFSKILNGDTEQTFQIGGASFTLKEWDKFLDNFDEMEDDIRELKREEWEKRMKEAQNMLLSESTQCTYPASETGEEDIKYITWYTEDGIFCRRAGQSEGYEWSIPFKNSGDYQKVLKFLNRFDRHDNLRFAARESFWQDFLDGKIE
ncbi:MAG: hypothetical protein J6K58_12775 [Lachnospiraceae bacterium]|nr:hypothetical protein [Lachnospiraceae bacterium]